MFNYILEFLGTRIVFIKKFKRNESSKKAKVTLANLLMNLFEVEFLLFKVEFYDLKTLSKKVEINKNSVAPCPT